MSLLDEVRQNIHGALRDHEKDRTKSVLDYFLARCLSFYEKPAENMAMLKSKFATKMKGDIFEMFAREYFRVVVGLKEVWLLNEMPEAMLRKLKLRRADVGIDLVGLDSNGGYHAIQAKYRKRNTRYKDKIVLGWKQLSTFFAIVSRTGPFVRHWVFTNADYCRRFGRRTPEDRSVCYQGLCGIRHDQWLEMAGSVGRTISDEVSLPWIPMNTPLNLQQDHKIDMNIDSDAVSQLIVESPKKGLTFKKKMVLSSEEMREKRLAYFNRFS